MASRKASSRATGAADEQDVNVQVILRCRPPSQEEVAQRVPQVIKCEEAHRQVTLTQHSGGKQLGRTYQFDRVFAPDTTQERLYDVAIGPIVEEVLEGFNCTIFAYGQTGTGKTHTMTGDINDAASVAAGAGVIPRAIAQIFAHLDGIGAASEFTVKCSFLELYNEEITDLLAIGSEQPKVRILEDRSGVVLQGLEEPHVKCPADIFGLLEAGSARRRTAETLLNKQSSRSHSVFIVTVSVREVSSDGEEVIRVGKLYLVDLAGSENVSRSGAVDARAKEAGNINKSLLTLGRVITALVEGQIHVPYRDSKLTRLLRDSLGGRTKTCIIATIAPTVQCQEETLSTLDYAHRAKNIKNKPEVNQKITKTTHLKEQAVEIARLRAELVATREKNGVYLPTAQYAEECAERTQMRARMAELEEAAALWEGRLADVRGELEAARQEAAERSFVLQAHRAAEEGLAVHAAVLTEGLGAAASDVAQLFARVDAKNELEDANLGLVRGLKETAEGKLGALEQALTAAAAGQAAHLTHVTDELQTLAGRKEEDARALAVQMAALHQCVTAAGTAARAAGEALRDAGTGAVAAVSQQQAAYLETAQQAAEEAAAALGQAYAGLEASLAGEQAALESLLSGQEAATHSMLGATTTLVEAVRAQLEAVVMQADEARSSVAHKFAAQTAAAEVLQSDFVASAQAEQAALLQQVQALVTRFVQQAEGRVTSAVAEMKGQLANNGKELGGEVGAIARHAGTSLQTLDANAAAAEAAAQVAAASLQEAGARVHAAAAATSACCKEVHAAGDASASAAAKALQKQAKTVAAAAKKEHKALEAAAAREGETCSAATADALAAQQTLQHDLQQSLAADESALTDLRQHVGVHKREAADLTRSQKAGLAEVAGVVRTAVDEQYAVDAERGAVPACRQHAVPLRSAINSLRAPPEEQLLLQFRADATSPSTGDDENEDPLPRLERKVSDPISEPAVLSPSLAGQKRSRGSESSPGEKSPSKLRATFQRSERRRGGRVAPIE